MAKHFNCYESVRRGIDTEGNERDYWSFHSAHANTFVGRTIGKLCIGFSAWLFHRRHPDPSPLAKVKRPES